MDKVNKADRVDKVDKVNRPDVVAHVDKAAAVVMSYAGLPWSTEMPAFTPFYRRIIDDIAAQIEDGRLPPGSQLPSTTELAEQFNTSVTTVRRAIRMLLDAGVVRGHQGLGVFVAEKQE